MCNNIKDNRLSVLVIRMTNYMGGIENYIYNLVTHSDKKRIKYDFLVLGFEKSVYYDELNSFYNDYDHFIFVPLYRQSIYRCICGLKRLYSNREYDVIYICGSAGSDVLFAAPYINLHKTAIVQHSHSSNHVFGWQHMLFRDYSNDRSVIKLACSDVAGRWLFGEKQDFEIIKNGIDTSRFTFSRDARKEIRKKYGVSEQTLLFGSVGRLSHEKNHLFLIRIFEHILREHSDSMLIIVGDGEEKCIIEDYIRAHNLSEKVLLAGITQQVDKYYSAFDAFVMPSLWEGLPVVGVEAQASGLICFFSSEIDKQILISDRAYDISINATAEAWASAITKKLSKNQGNARTAYSELVKNSGYDINDISETITQKLILAKKMITQ
jgi:glycosyltransferase involved in cell wall biosynthesis